MYYDEEQARECVINAGKRLLETGLVARTWGNISARISDGEFIITPSGRGYGDLLPEELVKVRISDGSWDGSIKPSSEKILHAGCYKLREDCGFIIHTHQLYATAISVAGKDFEFAPCARYAPPGTEQLASAVSESVDANPAQKAFLMDRHGAVLLGKDCEEAFALAGKLEKCSLKAFSEAVPGFDPSEEDSLFSLAAKIRRRIPAYLDDFAQILGTSADASLGPDRICSGEDAWAEKQILIKNCAAMLFAKSCGAKPMGFFDAKRQHRTYINSYSKLKETNK